MSSTGGIAGRIGAAAVARPRLTIALWLAFIGPLAALGLGVEDRLHRSALTIAGSPAANEAQLADSRFGQESFMFVLLDGPKAQVARQQRALAQRLARDRISLLGGLRAARKRDATLLIARYPGDGEAASRVGAPALRRAVGEVVRRPVAAHVSGYPDIAAGIHKGSVDSIRRFELISAPLLLLVLLLVFRSPIAAAVPLLAGLTTIAAASGLLDLVHRVQPLDALALNLATMMGLALGVDYSLLLVSRFREELAGGRDPRAAARCAAATAGHTVVAAGVVLAVAMVVAYELAPGDLLSSASIGTGIAVLLSVLAGLTAVPAVLSLLGDRVNAFAVGGRPKPPGSGRFAGWAARPMRRPALVAAVVFALILALAAPTLALETGVPDPQVLPKDRVERRDYDALGAALGQSWTAPYEVLIALDRGSITDPSRLAKIARWERDLAARKDVASVVGPGTIEPRTRPLRRVSGELSRADRAVRTAVRDQRRLAGGLAAAGDGLVQLRSGLADAAAGAERLETGGADAADGGRQIDAALARAGRGAGDLRRGLKRARGGAHSLASGARAARTGGAQLAAGLGAVRRGADAAVPGADQLATGLAAGGARLEQLREPARIAEAELKRALTQLDAMAPTSKLDSRYAGAYRSVATAAGAISGRNPVDGTLVAAGYDGLDTALASAVVETGRAAGGARELRDGLRRLQAGLARIGRGAEALEAGAARVGAGATDLESGLARLERGGADLESGIGRLSDGGGDLTTGLEQLRAGSGALAAGLRDGESRSAPLAGGLDQMRRGVASGIERTRSLGAGLARSTQLAGATKSGFFVLAALDEAPRSQRDSVGYTLNLDQGGSAARITVVGRGAVNRAGHPLRPVVENEAAELARSLGGTARVGGAAATLQDFDRQTSQRLPLLVIGLSLATMIVLAFVLRSLVLPAILVGLNLLTVGAAFGVLVLLFEGSRPLGGPGFLDAISVAGVFSVVFALSIDYALFLSLRMREGWLRTHDTEAAIAYGLRTTAGVVTGAALVMVGVFAAFATAEMVNLRQLGIGLAVAVLLDATLVRLVLLPAAVRLGGDACWRLPWEDARPEVAAPLASSRPRG